MNLEIDVSGDDLFNSRYTICVASKNEPNIKKIIRGFKFSRELQEKLIQNWKLNKYRYTYNDKEKKRGLFKVRIYCIIIYYIIKSLNIEEKIYLTICRDFSGRESTIIQNLKFLFEKDNIRIGDIHHQQLENISLAHKYAKMMFNDSENHLDTYIYIRLKDIERYLHKRKTTSMIR